RSLRYRWLMPSTTTCMTLSISSNLTVFVHGSIIPPTGSPRKFAPPPNTKHRSEERRVGKECKSRWRPVRSEGESAENEYECNYIYLCVIFFFSSRRRHTRSKRDWSSDVCSSDLGHCGTGG